MRRCSVRVGDLVREREGRHLGRVRAIFGAPHVGVADANICWLGSNWLSTLDINDLVVVEAAHTLPVYTAQQIRNRERIGLRARSWDKVHVIAATDIVGGELVVCMGDARGPVVATFPRTDEGMRKALALRGKLNKGEGV